MTPPNPVRSCFYAMHKLVIFALCDYYEFTNTILRLRAKSYTSYGERVTKFKQFTNILNQLQEGLFKKSNHIVKGVICLRKVKKGFTVETLRTN